jgi:NADPH:quinone reductase-like Zn-dependent oxidoreductase
VAIWPEYKRGLTVLLDLISGGQIRLPKITTVGTLSAETVRSAHQLMEEKHTQGKLVMSIA